MAGLAGAGGDFPLGCFCGSCCFFPVLEYVKAVGKYMTGILIPPLDCDFTTLANVIGRKPVLWVGAGMSIAADYPSANDLIGAMRTRSLQPLPAGDDYCAVADAFLAFEGAGSLGDLLGELFPSLPPTDWHHAAARLCMSERFTQMTQHVLLG